MFCPKCGKELPDNAKFCGACGANVNAPVSAPEPVAQSVAPQQSAPVNQTPAPQPATEPASQPAAGQPPQSAKTPAAEQPPQAAKPQVDVKGEISKLQGKLDNSNSSFLKGRSVWDVVGLCATALMAICFFLPALTSSSYSGTNSLSPASLMSITGSSSYTSSFSWLLLIYLFPAVCCAIDLLVTKENSTRHVRLIVLGLLNILLQSSISSMAKFINSFGGSLGVGFYLSIVASLVIIAVGIIGIYEKKKGKN